MESSPVMGESDRAAALLGRIAVKHRFITMEQLAEATRVRGRHGKKLGAILVELGMIDELQLGKILALQKRYVEQLQAKEQQPRIIGRVRKIPTPKDWVFDASKQRPKRREDRPLPRRGRRTADVHPGVDPTSSDRTSTVPGRLSPEAPSPEAASEAEERRRARTAPDGPSPAGAAALPRREATTAPERPAAAAALPRREATTAPERPAAAAALPRPEATTTPERPAAAAALPRRDAQTDPDGRLAREASRRTKTAPDRPVDVEPDPTAVLDEEWPGEAMEVELPLEDDPERADADAAQPATDPEPARGPQADPGFARAAEPDVERAPRRGRMPTPVAAQATRTTPSATSDAPPVSRRSAAPAASELAPVSLAPVSEPPMLEPRPAPGEVEVTQRVRDLHRFLEAAAQASGSDVHVHAGQPLKMRQFGQLVSISDKPLSPEATDRVLCEMLTPWQRDRLDDDGEVDFAYAVEGIGRFRANVYRHHAGTNGVFHFVPRTPPTLEELGLPTTLARLTNYAQGLILVTGPAGCGKTSTLAALVDIINTERSDHILTIEDPIEYLHPSKRCVVNQRQVGRHTTSFARALRGALREDPDIICIGELRDLETISLALSAAETGHLVLATLHTGSSIGTINRIVGAYPPNQQPQVRAMMSESLRAIISQRLVPRADGAGVVPALEILYVNKAVGTSIRDNRTFQINSVLQTSKAQGMQRLEDALAELVRGGLISTRAAREHGDQGGQ